MNTQDSVTESIKHQVVVFSKLSLCQCAAADLYITMFVYIKYGERLLLFEKSEYKVISMVYISFMFQVSIALKF